MADEIRADYDQLEQVASRFANQSQTVQQVLQQVRNSMDKLKDGWIGRGSDAFFSEMEGEVLPAIQKFHDALDEASRATRDVVQTMQQADEEASSPFRTA